jgi:oxygen-independent coproporphyrinogen III oxidase
MDFPSLIQKYNCPVPRYTSYPPAPAWTSMGEEPFCKALSSRSSSPPLSLYLHIPFCHSTCLYCGCSTVANRRPEVEEEYVNTLLKEISLIQSSIGNAHVNQIHFGGGTPSKLHPYLIERLVGSIKESFSIDPYAEMAIEIDPRTVIGNNTPILATLKKLGFNRISLGIQDFNPAVQDAIGRRQSEEVSTAVYQLCRKTGFDSINFDLVYGLPCQTIESFERTIDRIIALRPNRIAIFSFAYLPELKPLQKSIPPSLLPSTEEKFQIFRHAREHLLTNGYTAIGLDHFAVPEDPLSISLSNGSLRRTFQGYTVLEGHEVIGLGMTAISDLGTAFFQHAKTLAEYSESIQQGKLPTKRGVILVQDDCMRRFVIEQLMCQGVIRKKDFENRWGLQFDSYFESSLAKLHPLISDGLAKVSDTTISATPLGQLFLRNIASCFDAYLCNSTFSSRAI